MANINRDVKRKSAPFTPADFDPYMAMDRRRRRGKVSDDRLPGDISLLKVFVEDQKGGAS